MTEVQRNQQAQIVNGFVNQILAIDPNALVAVVGDINDFQFSGAMSTLKGSVLTPLIETLPESERYTYFFEGNLQALDHILATSQLLGSLVAYDVVHVNSEFHDQLSDHDPSVARFNLPPPATPTPTQSPTIIPTNTPIPTNTATRTPTPTNTATSTPEPTGTQPPATATQAATSTREATRTSTRTPTPTPGSALPDLAVTKTDSPDPVRVGELLTYQIEVSNLGPGPATSVTAVDMLPDNVALVSVASTQGSCDASGQLVVCRLGTLSRNDEAAITIRVRPTRAGLLVNGDAAAARELDPTPRNNIDVTRTLVLRRND